MPDLLTLLAVVLAAVFAFVLVLLVIILLKQNIYLKRVRDQIKTEQIEIANREATIQLEQWKLDYTSSISSQAIQSSFSTIRGNITTHFAPYLPDFGFNPNDVRFIGSPVDLIIFDGMCEKNLRRIIFAEVKSGKWAKLSANQRDIRDVVLDGQIEWIELRF